VTRKVEEACGGWASTPWTSSISTPGSSRLRSPSRRSGAGSIKLKDPGKVRHIGITEPSPTTRERMLAQAIQEAPWNPCWPTV